MILFYKILNGVAPKYLSDILPVSKNRHYSTENGVKQITLLKKICHKICINC